MNNSLDKATFIGDENKPNILSNELDQAPKVGKAYEERLQNPELQQKIFDAMDKYFLFCSKEGDGDEIVKWLEAHSNELPLKRIYASGADKVSFLIHKEKRVSTDSIFTNMIGCPLDALYQFSKLGDSFMKEELNIGEIGTYITFTKDESGKVFVGAEQIELPRPEFLGKGYACHKVLTSEEFKKILDEDGSQNNEGNKQEEAEVTEESGGTPKNEPEKKGFLGKIFKK